MGGRTTFYGRCLIISLALIGYMLVLRDGPSLTVSLVMFGILGFSILWLENRSNDFLSPLVCFVLFLLPYSSWFAFRCVALSQCYSAVLSESISLSFLGLLSFYSACLFVPPRHYNYSAIDRDKSENSMVVLNGIYYFSLGLLFVSSIVFMSSGVTSKRELLDNAGMLKDFSDIAAWTLTAVVVLGILDKQVGFIMFGWRVVLALLVLIFCFLVTGERDYIFRYLACVMFLYLDKKRSANVWLLILGVVLLAFILPVTQSLKSVLVSGEFRIDELSSGLLFNGEFLSSSRNMYMVVLKGESGQGIGLILGDVMRGLIPFSSDLGFESATSWYNNTYRHLFDFASTSGWGFGLIPEGYVVGGEIGIFFIMFAVSFVLLKIYNIRYRSKMTYTFYILALTSSIYCIRSDLANFLSQTFKIGLFVVLLIMLANKIAALKGR